MESSPRLLVRSWLKLARSFMAPGPQCLTRPGSMGRCSPNTPDFPSWTGMYEQEQPPSAAGADNDLLDSLVLFSIRTGAGWSYLVARLFLDLALTSTSSWLGFMAHQ